MALNPAVCTALEGYGLTNAHLEQLLALCQQHSGWSLTWHADAHGFLKAEIKLHMPMRDGRRMEELTRLLQREG